MNTDFDVTNFGITGKILDDEFYTSVNCCVHLIGEFILSCQLIS